MSNPDQTQEQTLKSKEQRGVERHRAQEAIYKEGFWFTLTTLSVNYVLMSQDIGLSAILTIVGSTIISLFALCLIMGRRISYINQNRIYDGKEGESPILANNSFNEAFLGMIKECSGSLFYFVLILFSFIGVICSKIYFKEIISTWLA